MNTKNQYNNIITDLDRQQRSLASQIKFSLNRSGKNKNWDYSKLTNNFENVVGNVGDILTAVKFGYAINGAHFKGTRSKANVTGVQLLLVDIDNTRVRLGEDGQPIKDAEGKKIPVYSKELTIEDALNHPFIKQYCSFIYTTASHRQDWHKLRLGFVLPKQIDRETYESLAEIILKEFPHDPACKDAGRVFFGNSNTEIILYNPEAVLDSCFIESATVKKEQDAIARRDREQELKLRREENKRRWEASGRTEQDLEELVRDALSHIQPRQKGSGNYDDCLKILTALRNQFGNSKGTAMAEEWSPPSAKDDWFPSRKKTNNSNISVGTIFHLAKQNGWQFPENNIRGWNRNEKISPEEYEQKFALPRILKVFSNKVKSNRKRLDRWGFSQEQIEAKRESLKEPRQYKKHERLDVWRNDTSKYIADSSQTGLGKSYDSGRLKPKDFEVEKAVYITSDPRNVTTPTLQNGWAVNQGRHGGLTIDRLGKTRRIKANEPLTVPGNCMKIETIAALSRKNVDGANTAELVCGGCAHYGLCKSGVRYGNLPTGYLGDRQLALSSSKIISHPSSLPSAEKFPYENSILIWDEWATIFGNRKEIKFYESDLKGLILHLTLNAPEALVKLQPMFGKLIEIFREKDSNRFGLNHNDLTEKLNPFVEGLSEDDIAKTTIATKANLDALNPTKEYDCNIWDMPKEVKKMMADPDSKIAIAIEESTIKQWIEPFLKVLTGGEKGYLCKSGKAMTVTIADDRLVDIARKAKQNIFLDATGNLSDLAAMLDIPVEEISHIVTKPSCKKASVKIVQVAGLGRLGQQRGKHQERQTAAITKALKEKHPGIRKIAFKRFAENEDLRWFVESRGSNDAEQAPALILEGVPTPNINALAAEFACIYGRIPKPGTTKVKYEIKLTNAGLVEGGSFYLEINESADPQFREFVRRKILSAIEQGLGRLRANRREDEELTIYVLGDYPLNCPVELVKASDITPEAGSKIEQFETALKAAIAQLHLKGKKITQTAVAQITNYSQSYISRHRKLLLLLIESFNSKSNNLDPPDRDTEWTAKEQLPLASQPQLIEDVLNFWEVLGDTEVLKLFDLLDSETLKRLVLGLLETQNEFVVRQVREAIT